MACDFITSGFTFSYFIVLLTTGSFSTARKISSFVFIVEMHKNFLGEFVGTGGIRIQFELSPR